MRERRQGGKLLSYVIIGGLLTLALVGGLYGLNRYSQERQAQEVAREDEAASRNDEASEAPAEEGRTTTPAPEEGRQSTSPSVPDPGDASPQPAGQMPSTGVQPQELPETGPADLVLGALVLSLITFVGTHYVRSLR